MKLYEIQEKTLFEGVSNEQLIFKLDFNLHINRMVVQ
jgi:hypothetical protein